MRNVKKLFFTTIALTLTSFLMKTVAVWFNVYLAGLIGSVGIGIFQLIMAIYTFAKTLSYGGMNLAATRLCIDHFASFRYSMRFVLTIAGMLGALSMAILYIFSDRLSVRYILTSDAGLALRTLSFSLPFVALSAALNGYMTAARKMSRYSIIQLCEQLVKIGLTVVFVKHLSPKEAKTALFLVCLAITLSEVASFSMAAFCMLWDVKKTRAKVVKKDRVMHRLLRIAVPDAIGSYLRSILNTVEHLLIPKGIRKSGASVEHALSDYGIVQGMALPVVLYPSSILGVLSGLLVPEIAECKQKNNKTEINYIINRVLHLSMIFSIGCCGVMFFFANEISLAVYGNTDSANFIRLLSPLVPVMYLDMATDGMLKGLDQQLSLMRINVIDSVLCVVLVWFCVPKMAVDGYLVTIFAAEIINFLLSFRRLLKNADLRMNFYQNLISPLICAGGSAWVGSFCLQMTKKPTPNLILSVGVDLIAYWILLRLSGGITKEDSRWLKRIVKP